MSRAERIEKELEQMRQNNRKSLPEDENDNPEEGSALRSSFNSFLEDRGRGLSIKKEVSFNNMSRGERIERELEEMRENVRVSRPEDENESIEEDIHIKYSFNSFSVDENEINDQPAIGHFSNPFYVYENEINDQPFIRPRYCEIPNGPKRNSYEKSFKKLNLVLECIKDLLSVENNYNSMELVVRHCDWDRGHPFLHRGSISDVLNGLSTYSKPASFEPHFIEYHIQVGGRNFGENGIINSFQFVINYSTHIDVTDIYKIGYDDYFVWGILPPHEGTLKRYKKYFDLTPRRLYHNSKEEAVPYTPTTSSKNYPQYDSTDWVNVEKTNSENYYRELRAKQKRVKNNASDIKDQKPQWHEMSRAELAEKELAGMRLDVPLNKQKDEVEEVQEREKPEVVKTKIKDQKPQWHEMSRAELAEKELAAMRLNVPLNKQKDEVEVVHEKIPSKKGTTTQKIQNLKKFFDFFNLKKRKDFKDFIEKSHLLYEKGDINAAIHSIDSALVLYPGNSMAMQLKEKYLQKRHITKKMPRKMLKSDKIIERRKKDRESDSEPNYVRTKSRAEIAREELEVMSQQRIEIKSLKINEADTRYSTAFNRVSSENTAFKKYEVASKITSDWVNKAQEITKQGKYREAFSFYEDAIRLGDTFFHPFTGTSYIWGRLFLFCINIGIDEKLAREAWDKESIARVKELIRSK